jgi:hypothetical protein
VAQSLPASAGDPPAWSAVDQPPGTEYPTADFDFGVPGTGDEAAAGEDPVVGAGEWAAGPGELAAGAGDEATATYDWADGREGRNAEAGAWTAETSDQAA